MNTVFSRNVILAGMLVYSCGYLAVTTTSIAVARDKVCRVDLKGRPLSSCNCQALTNKHDGSRVYNRSANLKICAGLLVDKSSSDRIGEEPPHSTPPTPTPTPTSDCNDPKMGDDSHYDKHDREANSTREQ